MRLPRALTWMAAPALLALASSPVLGQTLANDAKCLIVSNLFAKSKDAKAKRAAADSRYFYLGRMVGSDAQIEAALATQGKGITPQNAAPTMRTCARGVVQRANEVQAIGQRLSKTQGR